MLSPEATALLTKCAVQFRYYANNHRAKVSMLQRLAGSEQQVADTRSKAEVNTNLACEIEEFLQADRLLCDDESARSSGSK